MVLIDGRPLQPDIWRPNKYPVYSKSTFFSPSGQDDGQVYTTNLAFATLVSWTPLLLADGDAQLTRQDKTDEEDRVELRGEALAPLCKIEVYVNRGTAVRGGRMKYQTSATSVGVVHEKQLK